MTVTLEFFQTYHFVIGLLSAYNSTFFRYDNQTVFFFHIKHPFTIYIMVLHF